MTTLLTKLASGLLTFALVASFVPAAVFAQDVPTTDTETLEVIVDLEITTNEEEIDETPAVEEPAVTSEEETVVDQVVEAVTSFFVADADEDSFELFAEATYYVDASANLGGNGSEAAPYQTIADALAVAAGGDTIVVVGTLNMTSNVVVNKDVTIQGNPGSKIITSGTNQIFTITAAGATIQGLEIVKTDKTGVQNIIGIQAANVTISNNIIRGQYVLGDGEVSRALEISSVSNFTVTGNTINNLRQPAYINDNATGVVSDNYVNATRGWVAVSSSNVSFTGNSWGTNAVDIAIIPGAINNYTDIAAMSAANNGAAVENQFGGTPVLATVYVDDSATPGGNGMEGSPYLTIQEGVTRVAKGGTINVAAGNYAGNITLNKALVLVGESNQSVVAGQITVSHENVTVSGFTITNPTGTKAVLVNGVGNVTISNNSFTAVGSDASVNANVHAVWFQDGALDVVNLTIKNNTFDLIGHSNGRSATAIGIGDSTGASNIDGVLIEGNTITNVVAKFDSSFAGGGRGTYGILVNHADQVGANTGSTLGLEIKDNNISNLEGLWVHAIGLEGNTPDAVVTGNTISSLREHKLALEGALDGAAVFFEKNPSASSVLVNENSFDLGTALGVMMHSSLIGSFTIDATRNFWGSADPLLSVSSTEGSTISVSPWYVDAEMTRLNTDPEPRSSGRSGGSSRSTNTGTVAGASTGPVGQVLGASTYNFTIDLTIGSTGADVNALQAMLIASGDLAIATPTGYFGPLTQAALAKWQAARGIVPASGYFGPLTQAAIAAAAVTPAMTDEARAALLVELLKQVADLQEKLNEMMADES